MPIEAELLCVIEAYLASRAIRFPGTVKRKASSLESALSQWPARSPLFVGRDGERITRGTLQSRIKRAFKRAGPDAQPVPGALVHGLRHTYATELASSEVSVYTLMKLLGHESMTTSQRYVSAAGAETRSAAARNPIYAMIPTGGEAPAHQCHNVVMPLVPQVPILPGARSDQRICDGMQDSCNCLSVAPTPIGVIYDHRYWEHLVAVTDTGCEVLDLREGEDVTVHLHIRLLAEQVRAQVTVCNWFNPSIAHQYSCRSSMVNTLKNPHPGPTWDLTPAPDKGRTPPHTVVTHHPPGVGSPRSKRRPQHLPTGRSSKAESTKQKFEVTACSVAVSAHNPRCD